jgi:CyaY protein
MDENEFLRRADACLTEVAEWLEELDPDEVDYSTADGVVTMEFADGARFILSRQAATKQVWLAAGALGLHFSYEPASDRWVDDKDGAELMSKLAEVVTAKLGHPLDS